MNSLRNEGSRSVDAVRVSSGGLQISAGSPAISIVVPMLDGSSRLAPLLVALRAATTHLAGDIEIILVDDGSTDTTWDGITHLARHDPLFGGIRLAANVGQTNALCAGFSVASGEIIVMVDDDLEINSSAIGDLVAAVQDGADFASGRRHGPRPWIRALGSGLFNARLRRLRLPFSDAGCGANAMTADLAKKLATLGWSLRQHRFKLKVATLTERFVEVDVRCERSEPSHFQTLDLAASWLDVELHFGLTTLPRVVTLGVVGPATASGLLLALPRPRTGRLLCAAALAVTAGVVAEIIRRRRRIDRLEASTPPWTIEDRVGTVADPPALFAATKQSQNVRSPLSP